MTHAARKENSPMQNTFTTLNCVHGATLNTTAGGRQRRVKARAARKYAQMKINIQKHWQRELQNARASLPASSLAWHFRCRGQRGGMSEIF